MKKIHLIILILTAILIIGGILFVSDKNSAHTESDSSSGITGQEVTVYKTSTCGCCHVYAQYLKKEGMRVSEVDVADLNSIKHQYGIPTEMESCHTSIVGDYVIEGHIPVAVIEKLLTEKPDIQGIALPGMPAGSPGMPGAKTSVWTIFALNNDGSVTEFMKY